MSHTDRDEDAPAEAPEDKPKRSELEEGVEHLGRALGGVMTRLLGPKVTGLPDAAERPVLGAEADEALDKAGQTLGRWLHAAGEALQENPTSPTRAFEQTARKGREAEAPPGEEGVAPLAVGLRSLGKGLFRSTEAVLDKVAPRKVAHAEGADADAEVGEE